MRENFSDSDFFLGREQELKILKQKLLNDRSTIVLTSAQPGLGKTTLALNYYLKSINFYKEMIWLNHGGNIYQTLLEIQSISKLEFIDQSPIKNRISLLIENLCQKKGPNLLILDHVNEIEELKIYVNLLKRLTNFHIIIITEVTNFSFSNKLEIHSLGTDIIKELFIHYYEDFNDSDIKIFNQLNDSLYGNTLALILIAKTLQRHNNFKAQKDSLANLLADLGMGKIISGSLIGSSNSLGLTITNFLSSLYDLMKLTENEKVILSLLSVLPPDRIAFSEIELLLQKKNQSSLIYGLAKKGWITFRKKNIWISPNIQKIVREKEKDLFTLCKPFIKRLSDLLKSDIPPKEKGEISAHGMRRYSTLARYLLENINEPNEGTASLIESLAHFFKAEGDLYLSAYFEERYQQTIARLLDVAPPAQYIDWGIKLALSYSNLGESYLSLRNLEKAQICFEKQVDVLENLYKESPKNVDLKNKLAISYKLLGYTYGFLDNSKRALATFMKQSNLLRELNKDFPNDLILLNRLANSYQLIGDTFISLGNLQNGFLYYKQFKSYSKHLVKLNQKSLEYNRNLALANIKLGDYFENQGQWRKAEKNYKLALNILSNLIKDYPQEEEILRLFKIINTKLKDPS